MAVLKLHKLWFSENGTRINYEYTYDAAISKYFNAKNPFFASYSSAVDQVPEAIAVIPLLANVLPISWFAGFDIEVPVLDKTYYESTRTIRELYESYYPELKDIKSELRVEQLEETTGEVKKSALLFSGGVDAYTTFLRHREEISDLITIWGADIPLSDQEQWDRVQSFNDGEAFLTPYKNNMLRLICERSIPTMWTLCYPIWVGGVKFNTGRL